MVLLIETDKLIDFSAIRQTLDPTAESVAATA
jgi:hypothetical protein